MGQAQTLGWGRFPVDGANYPLTSKHALSCLFGAFGQVCIAYTFDTGGMAGQLSRATAPITEAATAITPEMTGPQAGEALREAIAAEQQLALTICLLTERVARTGEYPPTVPCRWLPALPG